MQSIGRRKFVSKSALSEILKELRELEAAGTSVSRQSLRRAREPELEASNRFGSVFNELDLGASISAVCLHPLALLQHLIDEAPAFSDYFKHAIDTHTNLILPRSAFD